MARPRKNNETTESPTPTPEERAIADRAVSQDTDWHTIREDELEDYSLSEDQFKLPPEALKMQDDKQYSFRWCERTAERIDFLTKSVPIQRRWTLVTRTTMPALENYVDPMLGCVCRYDQALLFRPWHFHQRERDAVYRRADAMYEAGSLDGQKAKIQDRDDDVVVSSGKAATIKGGDEIFYDEAASDVGVGDLVDE